MSNTNLKCAPSKIYEDGSCYSLNTLIEIATAYNEQQKNNIIKINNNKKDLVQQLEKILGKCQSCWLGMSNIDKLNLKEETLIEMNNNTFRPEGPSTQYEWLSTNHIDDVVKQYENVYNDFIFLGALPNDFETQPYYNFKNLDFNDFIKNGKTKCGMVINLDPLELGGSHWVALYFDLSNNKIYFFDSIGKPPDRRIKRFITKIFMFMSKRKNLNIDIKNIIKNIKKNKKTDLSNIFDNFDIRFNNIQHQFKNTECGVYSINFILRCVKGESFDDITKNITNDDDMNNCRNVYFRN